MNAIAQAQDLWLLAFAQTAPERTIGYLDQYVRHLQSYASNTAVGFSDIQLAERAYRKVYGMVAAGVSLETSARVRDGLAVWLNVWAPEVARSLAKDFIAYFKTFESLRKGIPASVNKSDMLRHRLEIDEDQWRCTIEALRIAEKFAPEEDGLWIYGAEFWSTLAAWAVEAKGVGLPLRNVPTPPSGEHPCDEA